MRFFNIQSVLFLLLLSSCSTKNNLDTITTHCICQVEEHFSISTDEEDNTTKEYTLSNSLLFENGIIRKDYALSAALLIYQTIDTALYKTLKLNFIKTDISEKTYTYRIDELAELSPTYTQINEIIKEFVADIHKKNYQACFNKTLADISEDEYNAILDVVRNSLSKDYISTEITSFEPTSNGYKINGSILDKANMKDLFKMEFINANGALKISSFSF